MLFEKYLIRGAVALLLAASLGFGLYLLKNLAAESHFSSWVSGISWPKVDLGSAFSGAIKNIVHPSSVNSVKLAPAKSKPAAPNLPKPAAAPAVSSTNAIEGKDQVRLGSIYCGSGAYPSLISLYYNLPEGKEINLTGWRIKSKVNEIFVPQAVELYDPSGFGLNKDIIVKGSGEVDLYSSPSPIGRNFRLNACSGYLNNLYSFQPPLPASCPPIYSGRSEVMGFSSACQDYLDTLSSCREPRPSELNLLDSVCQAFTSRASYAGCFNLHKFDKNFLSNRWLIYLGQSWLVDPRHDQVSLYNFQNQLVDYRLY